MQKTISSVCRGSTLFLFLSLNLLAQTPQKLRKIVLPNPQLIHCRASDCSQLWKQDSLDGTVYPGQVLTDFVDGSIVGLTAAYEKSVSIEELRAAINERYATWAVKDLNGIWRVEPEKLVIQLTEQPDGTKQLIYLQFGASLSQRPAAHIGLAGCDSPDGEKTNK